MNLRREPRFAVALILFLFATAASARVLSYAPYSDRSSFPALQHRMNRYFVLIEGNSTSGGPLLAPYPYYNAVFGQVVLYDSFGLEEPRVIFPEDGSLAGFSVAAVREDANHVPTILLQTDANYESQNPQRRSIFFLSTDGGEEWRHVLIPDGFVNQLPGNADIGGPYARGFFSPVRIGNSDFPFVVDINGVGIYAVSNDAAGKLIYGQSAASVDVQLIGSNRAGTSFLIRTPDLLMSVDLDGNFKALADISPQTFAEGWITADGSAYLQTFNGTSAGIWFVRGGPIKFLTMETTEFPTALFAIPAFDYEGAWIIQRAAGQPTILSRHTPTGGIVNMWEDITSPQVEALHAGASGNTLLIQVHRPRPQADQRLFLDPALAIWRVGERAPRAYDELFMNEQYSKGFVHLDVDLAAQGAPFVFDSGAAAPSGIILSPAPPPSAGGSDVIQEWGVVQASLQQRLVLPGVAKLPGAFNSYWTTDVILYNPLDQPQRVTVRYIPTGQAVASSAIDDTPYPTITLGAHEIRFISDVLHALFALDAGGGALIFSPEFAINVTSRTYSTSSKGTFGFGLNAIDMFNSIGPRFPVTFSGAFPGSNFRTNLIVADVSGRGGSALLSAAGSSGIMGSANISVDAPANGVQQFNDVRGFLGLEATDMGALRLQPARGSVIPALVAIDNLTNDPTYFPPDLPSPFVRTIPAIGHLDGANNSKFRSDLYLYNPTPTAQTITLQATPWDSSSGPIRQDLTLLANEARVVRDALFTLFNKTGIARLRYSSPGGVRVTSRTYSINDDGGTYGFLMPPLNNFQIAGSGDSLEILGALNDARFRTNVGFVDLAGFTSGPPVDVKIEIINENGIKVDEFTTNLSPGGGRQIDDIFRTRGVVNVKAALIRLTPINGMIGAYAASVDQGTNDPTYMAANLASH